MEQKNTKTQTKSEKVEEKAPESVEKVELSVEEMEEIVEKAKKYDEIMALKPDGTVCFLGWAGRMCYHAKGDIIRVDYEKYIDGEDYII